MLLSLYLSPDFSNLAEIESFRSTHDPLASKISPHVTLVFPFESSSGGEELCAHARAAAESVGCFELTLGRPEIRGEYVWLPVMEGRDAVVALHDALYHGPLVRHLDATRPYEPHVTIARVCEGDVENVHRLAVALRGPFEAYVDRLFVELVLPDKSSRIEHVIELETSEPFPATAPGSV